MKSSTNTTATVPAGTAPTYGLHVAVEPKTSDPRGVAARLDSATITVDGVTATHVTYASDDVEKKDDDTFMFGLTTLVFALICAGVALLVAILVCCVREAPQVILQSFLRSSPNASGQGCGEGVNTHVRTDTRALTGEFSFQAVHTFVHTANTS